MTKDITVTAIRRETGIVISDELRELSDQIANPDPESFEDQRIFPTPTKGLPS